MADNDAAEVRLSAEALYAQGQCIWDSHDLWNTHKRAQIFARKRALLRGQSHIASS